MQYAPPAELLYGPKDEFVADFVGADRGLKGLQLIRTKEVMWRSPRTAKPDEEVKAVRDRMEREGIDWLAVIDDEGRFTGWVVSSDLERGQKVREIMSTSAISATRNAVLSEALSLMLTSGLNVLAIVDQHDRLEGVLTFQAIREALREAAQKASVRLGRTTPQREASQ